MMGVDDMASVSTTWWDPARISDSDSNQASNCAYDVVAAVRNEDMEWTSALKTRA